MIRDSSIYITRGIKWKLTRLAKAQGKPIDEVAENILANYIGETHPKLNELWEQRNNLDEIAEEISNPQHGKALFKETP